MATCKDCIGNDYCFVKPQHPRMMEKSCKKFKNKADFAEVKHGAWNYIGIAYECNLCGKSLVVEQGDAEMNYCPHCGAKMDGRKEKQ